MAVYFSRRKLHPKEEEEMGELNIVPYLDIMMNLIMFMLLTMTALITLGVLNVTAPSYGGGASSAAAGDQKKLILTVAISRKGFFVAAQGGVLPGSAGAADQPTIPLKSGDFDYDTLTQKMIDIKHGFPTTTAVILTADSDLPYHDLVRTMDAVREYTAPDGKHPLFYDVSLSAGVM
ncbi:MAG: ExbD/TolR family protein [Deltaproteobacteria bacterium]